MPQAGTKLGRDDVRHYVHGMGDMFVHLARAGGKRRMAEIAITH